MRIGDEDPAGASWARRRQAFGVHGLLLFAAVAAIVAGFVFGSHLILLIAGLTCVASGTAGLVAGRTVLPLGSRHVPPSTSTLEQRALLETRYEQAGGLVFIFLGGGLAIMSLQVLFS